MVGCSLPGLHSTVFHYSIMNSWEFLTWWSFILKISKLDEHSSTNFKSGCAGNQLPFLLISKFLKHFWLLASLFIVQYFFSSNQHGSSWAPPIGPPDLQQNTSCFAARRRLSQKMCNLFKVDVEWPNQVSTSTVMPQLAYVIFIGMVASLFIAMQILHLIEFIPISGGFYFIFLTNWTLLLETMTLVMLFASTLWGYLTPPDEPKSAPLFVKCTMSFWYIIQPMSLIATILYWTIVNEFWDHPYPIGFASYWAHLLNWMVLIVILVVSRLPFSLKNGIWSLIFTFIYMLWTVIHYFLEIGQGDPCDDYNDRPINECPIYNAVDWNEPALAILHLAGAFVTLVLVLLYYVGLVRCRGRGDLARRKWMDDPHFAAWKPTWPNFWSGTWFVQASLFNSSCSILMLQGYDSS